jgi:hypothetical protein
MNGAITEPFDRTSSEPKIIIIIKTGKSQNFFRTRRNIQNSRRNETISDLGIDVSSARGGSGQLAKDSTGPPGNHDMSEINPE